MSSNNLVIPNTVVVKDALHNFSVSSGASNEYCRGIVVGIVAGYISMGMTWIRAIVEVSTNLPDTSEIRELNANCLPIGWESDIRSMYEHHQRGLNSHHQSR